MLGLLRLGGHGLVRGRRALGLLSERLGGGLQLVDLLEQRAEGQGWGEGEGEGEG